MLSSNRQLRVLMVSALAGSLLLAGCATKTYVRQTVDAKVAPLDKKITDLSATVKDNAERIDAVDARARGGIAAATAAAGTAQTAANAAQATATQGVTAAGAAQTAANGAATAAATANQGVTAANTRITAVDAKFNLLDRYTAGPIQTVTFKVGSAVLSDDAKKTLDGIAGPIANLPSGYQVSIQGFASAEGKESANIALSEERAESVQRYLVSKNVALIRISIVGNGPIGDKKSKEADRAPNRRVEVRVYRSN